MRGAQRIAGAAVVTLLLAGGVAVVRGDDGERRPVSAAREQTTRAPGERPEVPPTATSPGQPAPDDSGPAPGETTVRAASAPGLRAYGDCGALVDHVRGAALEHVTPYGLPQHGRQRGEAVAMPTAAPASGGSADSGSTAGSSGGGSGSSAGFSGTNVQEAGVDEPDVVKNDGRRAFTVFGSHLRAVVFGDDGLRAAGELDLGLAGEVELLEVGDRLVAMSSTAPFTTSIVTVDVADPDDLAVVRRVEVEGAYLSARRIGDTVRLVVTQNGPAFDFVHPRDRSDEKRALEHNRRAVARADLAEWLPDVTVHDGPRLVPAPACGSTYVTDTFAGPGSTTVLTISPTDGTVLDATAVLASASEVYASADHLYVATGTWEPGSSVKTEIHRFDVSDPQRSVYEASGSVPGHLLRPAWFVGPSELGQWAMSEHEGDLRVATTIAEPTGTSNAVTILRRAGERLVPIGAVGGLGVNEQLYAVRFMGARGYVVTYRKVDPLYVIDLADPTAPSVVGELKVPGYSAYLHPIGDGLLLGVGQSDDDEDGMAEGSQASVFDVRDPANPQRRSHRQLGDRGSITGAEADHRTFTWWPEPARAVLTMSNWEDPSQFHGAVVLDPIDGLREVGRVEHRVDDSSCAAPIVRSRVLGDALLTFSAAGIEVHALADLAARDSLRYDGAAAPASCPSRQPPARDDRPRPVPVVPGAGD